MKATFDAQPWRWLLVSAGAVLAGCAGNAAGPPPSSAPAHASSASPRPELAPSFVDSEPEPVRARPRLRDVVSLGNEEVPTMPDPRRAQAARAAASAPPAHRDLFAEDARTKTYRGYRSYYRYGRHPMRLQGHRASPRVSAPAGTPPIAGDWPTPK